MLKGKVHPVEHIKIGKHVFPIWSHPLLRKNLRDEVLLEQEIEKRLYNPELLHAVNEVVERLLQEGVTGSVSEEMVEDYLEAALDRLDNYFSDKDPVNTSPTPLPNRLATSGNCHNVLPAVRTPPSSVRRVFPSTGHKRAILPTHTPPVQQQRLRTTCGPKPIPAPEKHVKNEADSEMRSLALVGLSRQRLFPMCAHWSDEASDDGSMLSFPCKLHAPSPHSQREKGGQQTSKRFPSRQFKSEAPPEWRKAVRSLFYSMLSLRLEESGGVQLEEMDLRGGAMGLLRLQGCELSALSPQAFGALDVTLDGNSSAIHCRQPAEPSILQRSHIQRAEKPIGVEPSALRGRVMAKLAQSHFISTVEKKCVHATGNLLSHAWGNAESSAALRTTGESGQLQLPSDTTRSRALASILEKKNVQK
ncbi:putative DNA mismatch repair protein MSH2 [Trypanosoma rangeli]|uniref:Putative DNA mismatch repair protein MSH2 n=1 Tax=Trypanosoma rangeli TaxID=5698 RepID=A0A3R7MLZ0_TRYRA|nr:putative DNA mismatch repair protein MSH2 [Trypanosoma rangeli]RNF04929.1 putative DNA mismatch repair protein MSH2 [Trypanosoma rangeli]|eukprot:RNF04929.1 putative DNA mismatch repair protein MSH2 [Trypanosoma rangeli]